MNYSSRERVCNQPNQSKVKVKVEAEKREVMQCNAHAPGRRSWRPGWRPSTPVWCARRRRRWPTGGRGTRRRASMGSPSRGRRRPAPGLLPPCCSRSPLLRLCFARELRPPLCSALISFSSPLLVGLLGAGTVGTLKFMLGSLVGSQVWWGALMAAGPFYR